MGFTYGLNDAPEGINVFYFEAYILRVPSKELREECKGPLSLRYLTKKCGLGRRVATVIDVARAKDPDIVSLNEYRRGGLELSVETK